MRESVLSERKSVVKDKEKDKDSCVNNIVKCPVKKVLRSSKVLVDKKGCSEAGVGVKKKEVVQKATTRSATLKAKARPGRRAKKVGFFLFDFLSCFFFFCKIYENFDQVLQRI